MSPIPRGEGGATLVMVAMAMVAIMGAAALAIDIGFLYSIRTELQRTADAAALAGVSQIPESADTRSEAISVATVNERGDASVLVEDDVVLGSWDWITRTFDAGGTPTNAVRVVVRRSQNNGNPVGTWFARVIGFDSVDITATAIAARHGGGVGSRFIIDDEMIDKDEPPIEALAAELGWDPEELITDNGDPDWYVQLNAVAIGRELELPTGQVGDEALFDMGHPEFPFSQSSDPSFEDFLNFNEDGSWRQDLLPDYDDYLDPLPGVSQVDDPDLYPSYVTNECQVSPVYKSDVSVLNPLPPDDTPAVNVKGMRRGILAYKIIGVGADPPGSYLPNLIIQICDPASVPPLSDLGVGVLQGARLVL